MSAKWALVIANTEYADPKLAKLTAPGKDAEAFAGILKAPDLAAFDEVLTVLDGSESVARRAIAKFFASRQLDDLLLLYFSGHGIRDDQGRLFLAMTDTDSSMLDATAISAEFITRQMDNSRSKRQVLILDCCNSGAFASGMKAATGTGMGTGSAFEGAGYGRVVLTASDATQFAWEGDKIIGQGTTNSLFTHFLVKGLEGEADTNGDSIITVDELYDYAYGEIVKRTPKQTPGKWTYREQGEIVLTTRVKPQTIKPLPLDPDLEESLLSTRNYIREAAVNELCAILHGPNVGKALSAELRLQYVAENDDSRAIAHKADQLLKEYRANRAIAAQIQTSAPPPATQGLLIRSETAQEESAPGENVRPPPPEASMIGVDIKPASHAGPFPSLPGWRKYAAIAAIGAVALGVVVLGVRSLLPTVAVPPIPPPTTDSPTPTPSKVPSTATGTAVPPVLGTWGIDYYPSIELGSTAVYHADQLAQKNPEGGYALQIKSIDVPDIAELPSSNFSMRLSGLFYFSGGTYEFHCVHEDGCRVYVDGENWIDAWRDGVGSQDLAREITEGNHVVSVEFYDKSGQGSLQVLWTIKPQNTPTPTVTATATRTPTIAPTARPTKKKDSPPPHICLALGTKIDTPDGPVPVQYLKIGDLVWTQGVSGTRIAMPVAKIGQVAIPLDSQIVHLVLSDGREVWASPGHPTADGRLVGDLKLGDWVDGAQVNQARLVPYASAHTYDILPDGGSGVYWADGILLGSTLQNDPAP